MSIETISRHRAERFRQEPKRRLLTVERRLPIAATLFDFGVSLDRGFCGVGC